MSIHNVNGVNIISLHGSWKEMGRQYGELADRFLHDVLRYIEKMTDGDDEKMKGVIDIAEKLISHYPDYLHDFFSGMAETSSLSPLQLKMCNALEYAEACFFCSAMAAWDEYTDGRLIFGRNYDAMSYSELSDDVVITVYHPDDALSFATIGYAGEIYCVNGFNETGFFVELNNGMPSAGFDIHWELRPSTTELFELLSKARSFDDVEHFFATTHSFSSFIITVANAAEARAYEWCYEGVKKTEGILPKGIVVSTNHYVNDAWTFPVPDDDASWQSHSRRCNLEAQAKKNKGRIDASIMKSIMDTPIALGGPYHEFTRYQLVVEPSLKHLWIKTGSQPWTLIDISQYL